MDTSKNTNFSEKFKIAYNNLYNLHPSSDNGEFKLRYLNVDWFFPNHLNNVLENIKDFAIKYFDNINPEISLYGGLFHDAGLVYKRESADPTGHEDRSVEYAKKELGNLGYDDDFIEKVSECIRSTEPVHETTIQEALLVRNADSYAHLMSMHFFAKANFAENIYDYVNWFDKKVNSTFSKLTIDELINDSKPLVTYYGSMIKNYRDNKDRDFLNEIV